MNDMRGSVAAWFTTGSSAVRVGLLTEDTNIEGQRADCAERVWLYAKIYAMIGA